MHERRGEGREGKRRGVESKRGRGKQRGKKEREGELERERESCLEGE